MCLLVHQPEGTVFDDAFLRGVYAKNSDGIGVMYAEDETLHIHKLVPTSFDEMKEFYDTHVSGRACAIHWRMKTHGEIDLDNCHPYEVLNREDGYIIWLMHNGVLSTGNAKDVKMSDTWHYIQDYLRPMLKDNPKFFLTEAFAEVVGGHIGSGNKFALMDSHGNTVIVNKKSGVMHNNAWLSNTYAWDTTGTEHGFRGYGYGGYSGYTVPRAQVYTANKDSNVVPISNGFVDDDDEYSGIYLTDNNDMEDWVDAFDSMLLATDFTWKQQTKFDRTLMVKYYRAVGSNRAWILVDQMYTHDVSFDKLYSTMLGGRVLFLPHQPALLYGGV